VSVGKDAITDLRKWTRQAAGRRLIYLPIQKIHRENAEARGIRTSQGDQGDQGDQGVRIHREIREIGESDIHREISEIGQFEKIRNSQGDLLDLPVNQM
jgi:hypothetical protein